MTRRDIFFFLSREELAPGAGVFPARGSGGAWVPGGVELRRARPREELRVSPEVMTVRRGRRAAQATVGKPRGQLGRARLKPATGELLQAPGEAAPRRRSERDARCVESGSGPGRDGWARRRSAQEERGTTRVNFGRGGPDVGWSTPALLLAAPRAGAPGGSWPGGLGLGTVGALQYGHFLFAISSGAEATSALGFSAPTGEVRGARRP